MAVRTSFTAGEVLAAADLTDTFGAKLNLAGGKVLQVIQTTTTTSTTIASTTLTDTTLTATITPSNSANKVLVIVEQAMAITRSTIGSGGALAILRGSTVVYGNDIEFEENFNVGGASNVAFRSRFHRTFLDSPNTTSAVTYKTQAKAESTANSGQVVCQFNSVESTITLMEVSA